MKFKRGEPMIVLEVEDRKFLDKMLTPANNVYESVARMRRSFTKFDRDEDGEYAYEDKKEATYARSRLNDALNKIIRDCRKLEAQAEDMKAQLKETKGR